MNRSLQEEAATNYHKMVVITSIKVAHYQYNRDIKAPSTMLQGSNKREHFPARTAFSKLFVAVAALLGAMAFFTRLHGISSKLNNKLRMAVASLGLSKVLYRNDLRELNLWSQCPVVFY